MATGKGQAPAMIPTEEQDDAIGMFFSGVDMAIEAGAGTGKTATLQLIAEEVPNRSGQYAVFNRAPANDAVRRMPASVSVSTIHSCAVRSIDRAFLNRAVEGRRQPSWKTARDLGIDKGVRFTVDGRIRVLSSSWLAGHVMRALRDFTLSQDPDPAIEHFPVVFALDTDIRFPNNRELAEMLLPHLNKAWADMQSPTGTLRYTHDCYVKTWALTDPQLPVDFVLVDEAQDLSPVHIGIFSNQAAQVVWVGDSCQQIYEWRGAINALRHIPTDCRTYLTRSFRFGPPIADAANKILARLDTDLVLTGDPDRDSRVDRVRQPRAVLTRTNAVGVERVLHYQERDVPVHLVGQGIEVIAFARAAEKLKETGDCDHPEIGCFSSWRAVQEYCLGPETNVLRPDLSWDQISGLQPGDEVVAFDEHAAPGSSGRRYRTAEVTGTRSLTRPCRRVWMQDGTEVMASVDHRWLVKSGYSLRWKRTEMLRPGDEIASVGQWEPEDSREAGWLAGMFDGEGNVHVHGLEIAQNDGPVLDRLLRGLKERGFAVGLGAGAFGEECRHVNIHGGFAERLRLLGTLRPERLIKRSLWEGMRVEARLRSVVRGIEDVGEQEVIALATSTHTFIAEGLLSHNCAEDPLGSELKLLVDLVDKFGTDTIIEALDDMIAEDRAEVVVSTAHKAKGREWDTVQLASDFPELAVMDPEDYRLMYVAVTRAREVIDPFLTEAWRTLGAFPAPVSA